MVLKRIGAYIVDFILVVLIITIIGMFIPNNNKYNDTLNNQIDDLLNSKGNKDLDKTTEEIQETTYKIAKESVLTSSISVCIYFLYFAVLPFYNKGQTPGKMLTKIKIKSNNEKLSLWQTSLRGVFIYPYLFSLLDIILIVSLSKSNYLSMSNAFSTIQSIILFVCLITIIFNKGIGLHDMIGKTCVVSASEEEIEESVGNATKWKEKTEGVKRKQSTSKGINSERVKNHTRRKDE